MSSFAGEISFDSLNELAVRKFPEIASRYQEELEAWKGEVPGQHIVFADVLTPYLVELIDGPDADDRIRSSFEFLEKLARQPDPRIREVVALSVIDPLRNRYAREKWVRFLGPAMSKMLQELEYS